MTKDAALSRLLRFAGKKLNGAEPRIQVEVMEACVALRTDPESRRLGRMFVRDLCEAYRLDVPAWALAEENPLKPEENPVTIEDEFCNINLDELELD